MQKQVHKNRLDMQKLLNTLYNLSAKKDIIMVLDDEAEELYDQHHDDATTFRKNNIFEERRVSSMSKSIGLSMRLAGIICLLRNVISILDEQEENEEEENEEDEKPITFTVIKSDFNMALKITLYPAISFKNQFFVNAGSHRARKSWYKYSSIPNQITSSGTGKLYHRLRNR